MGEVVFMAESKCSSPTACYVWWDIVELVTSGLEKVLLEKFSGVESGSFGEGEEHFGGGIICRAITYLIAVGNGNRHRCSSLANLRL